MEAPKNDKKAVCPESMIDSSQRREITRKAGTNGKSDQVQKKNPSAIYPESGPSSSGRRGFIRKAAILTAAVGVGGALLGSDRILPESSARSDSEVIGKNCSPCGNAVYGLETATKGTGVYGTATGFSGIGVAGVSSCPGMGGTGVLGCGETVGVCGFSACGVGVQGRAGVFCSVGVRGVSCTGFSIPLVAQGVGCGKQERDLQKWNIGCCTVDVVNSSGWLGIGTCAPSSELDVNGTILGYSIALSAPVGTSVPLIAQGAAGQSAYLQEWENSCGKVLSAINKDGWLGIGSICDSKIRPLSPICVTGTIAACGGSSDIAIFGHNVGCSTVGTPAVSGVSCNGVGVEGVACCVGAVPLVARARVSEQIANLQQWEKACTTLSVVNKCGWLGLGTSVPTTTLNVNGSMAAKIVSATSSYKMGTSDFAVLASGAITVTLPKASTAAGMIVFIKNTSTSKVTVKGFTNTKETDTIEGASTKLLKKQYDSLQLISNGTNEWFILGNSICAAFTS